MNVETVGQHVEAILDRIGRTSPGAMALAEDLLAELMGLYGAGLQRILDRLATADPAALGDLATDPLVAGLMALHDLHPVDLRTRVEQALEQVRPYLGSHGGGVRLLGIEGDVVQLELQGSCDGCGSSAATVQYAVEGAVREAAPEISRVEVAGVEPAVATPSLISAESLRRRPTGDAGDPNSLTDGAGAVAGTSPGKGTQDGWVALSLDQPMGVEPAGHRVGDADLVLLERDGQLLAYRDACPGCGDSLVSGPVQGDVLCCPGCGRGYDVRLAGRAVDDGNAGLAPVPLLQQDGAVRIATGALR